MGRIIKLEVGEKTYNLEFNRRTLLLAADAEGVVNQLESKADQYDALCKFIRIAFLKNYPDITLDEVADIVDSIDDLEGFIQALIGIVEGSIDLFKQNKGNAHWEVN